MQSTKEMLAAHIEDHHATQRGLSAKPTFSEMSQWHANQHFRYHTSHIHESVNVGPDRRPPGWYDGSGAVKRS